MNVSYGRLELVPHGVGRIQVRATNCYPDLKPGAKVQMNLTADNDGTRRLDNIKVRADVPLNWLASVAPALISSLLPGKEERIAVTTTPPPNVSVGDYEAIIKTEAFASNRKMENVAQTSCLHAGWKPLRHFRGNLNN
ncbi:MAG: NEW3 domain-containing protein [candidate division KSB1 bacterium]|nr:NEW3 domain-containing protein [candidate division KSB1 bacterium]